MNVSAAKENILKKIRQALSNSTPLPFPQSEGNSSVFHPAEEEPEVIFAKEFSRLGGRFAFCANIGDLKKQLTDLAKSKGWQKVYYSEDDGRFVYLLQDTLVYPNGTSDLAGCDASVTPCECLIARTGSIVLSASLPGGRSAAIYAPVHVCIAFASQVVYDIKDALQLLKEKYGDRLPSMINLATGPSRTADIEKTLIVGVHGPKEVYTFLVDEAQG